MKNEERLSKELKNLFLDHPEGAEAQQFWSNFGLYSHMIDDLIDRDIPDNPETFGAILMMACNLYSCNFYVKYQQHLYHAIHMIHHIYFDSVRMERSKELWKKEHADVLKSMGIQLSLTIIEILGEYNKRRELSDAMYKFSYEVQHDENGNPLK